VGATIGPDSIPREGRQRSRHIERLWPLIGDENMTLIYVEPLLSRSALRDEGKQPGSVECDPEKVP
jgi:hypothetical protein